MFKVVKQALGGVVRYCHSFTVVEAGIRSLVQIQYVVEKFNKSVFVSMGSIVSIRERVSKLKDKAVDEHL